MGLSFNLKSKRASRSEPSRLQKGDPNQQSTQGLIQTTPILRNHSPERFPAKFTPTPIFEELRSRPEDHPDHNGTAQPPPPGVTNSPPRQQDQDPYAAQYTQQNTHYPPNTQIPHPDTNTPSPLSSEAYGSGRDPGGSTQQIDYLGPLGEGFPTQSSAPLNGQTNQGEPRYKPVFPNLEDIQTSAEIAGTQVQPWSAPASVQQQNQPPFQLPDQQHNQPPYQQQNHQQNQQQNQLQNQLQNQPPYQPQNQPPYQQQNQPAYELVGQTDNAGDRSPIELDAARLQQFLNTPELSSSPPPTHRQPAITGFGTFPPSLYPGIGDQSANFQQPAGEDAMGGRRRTNPGSHQPPHPSSSSRGRNSSQTSASNDAHVGANMAMLKSQAAANGQRLPVVMSQSGPPGGAPPRSSSVQDYRPPAPQSPPRGPKTSSPLTAREERGPDLKVTSMLDVGDSDGGNRPRERQDSAKKRPDPQPTFERSDSSRYGNDVDGGDEGMGDKFARAVRGIGSLMSKKDSRDYRPKEMPRGSESRGSYEENLREGDVKRLKDFLKDFRVPKNKYLDDLGRLLDWIQRELKGRDDHIQNQSALITSLKNQRDTAEDGLMQTQKELAMTKANFKTADAQLTETKAGLERMGQYASGLKQNLQTTEKSLETVTKERNQAQAEVETLTTSLNNERQEFQDWHNIEAARIRSEFEARITQLETQLSTKEQDHRAALAHNNRVHEERAKQVEKSNRTEWEKITAKVTAMELQHDIEKTQLKDAHAAEMESAQIQFNNIWYNDTEMLRGDINSLREHMAVMSQQSSYTPITDGEFQVSLERLANRVNNLNAWVPKPETLAVDRTLDPSGYVARNAQKGGRIWPNFVRNLCWRILYEGFFAQPLGFGVLGGERSEGYSHLDAVRQLVTITADQDPSVTIFPNDKGLNKWRATTFDGLLKGVRCGLADNPWVRLFSANVAAVAEQLTTALLHASANRLDPKARAEIGSIAQAVGELALEMGSQRAHVYMETSEHGQRAPVARFKDAAEEDDDDAETVAVDLMTVPCLRRLGDGRDNLSVEVVIVTGSVVSLKGALMAPAPGGFFG